MAEKKKYNSILVSGRKDQTLTYSKYVKDEESGESVKESLDKKVNVTDELTTQQIKDGAITNEKMAADSVGNSNLQDGSVSNEKLEDGSITNEKLAENSITKDKLKDNTIGVEKLDPELRQTINAATGLPENLVETIQNVDDTLKKHQRQLDDKQQQITANDEDISLLQTRSTQMEETIKDIAATGGASQASAVTYNNEKSKLTAINIQSAVDEVVDKTAIKDEEEAVVETPFRYIQNEEFIFAKVDAEDKLLFGFQWDGTPVFGKTSAVEDRLQSQVNLLADKITTILGDDDTTSAIDTLKELKNFFASIDNTQTLTSILANLNNISTKLGEDIKNLQDTKVDKEEGKSLIEDEVKECFRIIENEEFLKAIVDSDDKVLFGFYRATGKPYYPLNEMYHVIQNEEYFAAWLDSADHVLLGIRRDNGEIIGEIHAVNALKQVISQLQSDVAALQEKVGTIDTNLKELLDVFSLQDNEEYLAVEQDAEGKVLSATNPDGSHYIHYAKSETIPEEFSHIEDPEGRTEITTDADDKLLGYREKDGTKYEHKQKVENMSVNHFSNLSQTACQDIVNSLSAYGLTLENKLDFSDNTDIFIPIPRGVAVVNIIADSLATSKTQNKDAILEFWGSGIYFRKNIILNAQGQTSINFAKKSQSLDFKDGTSIKFGDWVSQDSFHLKANADDVFCGLNNVVYKYADYVVGKTDTRANRVLCSATTSYQNASGNFNADFDDNAKCMPDGFPISLHLNGEFYGMYTWNMKKHRANYSMNKKDYTSIMIDPDRLTSETFWNGTIDWSKFELKNPKTLICMDGSKYDGDNPKELIDSTSEKYDESNKDMKNTAITKSLLVRLSNAMPAINALTSEEEKKAKFKELFDYENLVVYFLVSNAIGNYDGLWGRNTVFTIYNSGKCGFNFYDCNAVFGREARGFYNIKPDELEKATGTPFAMLFDLFQDELSAKYKVLRDKGFISTDTIIKYLEDWLNMLGAYSVKKNMEKWNNIVSYRDGSKTYESYPQEYGFFDSLERCKKWLEQRITFMDSTFNYNVKQ